MHRSKVRRRLDELNRFLNLFREYYLVCCLFDKDMSDPGLRETDFMPGCVLWSATNSYTNIPFLLYETKHLKRLFFYYLILAEFLYGIILLKYRYDRYVDNSQ